MTHLDYVYNYINLRRKITWLLMMQGFVLSDWKGIDRLKQPRGLDRNSIARAINAGIDMVVV